MAELREPVTDYVTTVGTIVRRVTTILADNDPASPNTRWPVAELVDFVNEGCREIVMLRQEAFAKTIRMSLKPGALQSVPDQYQSFYSIEEAYDSSGDTYVPTEVDYRYSRLLNKPTIAWRYGETYLPRTFTRHPLDERIFYVDPAVPPGAKADIATTVVSRPHIFTPTDLTIVIGIKPEFEAQLVDWVLYRAMSKDQESAVFMDQAKRYLESFRAGLEYKGAARRAYHHSDSNIDDNPKPTIGGRTQ